jgi:hypothetical protein
MLYIFADIKDLLHMTPLPETEDSTDSLYGLDNLIQQGHQMYLDALDMNSRLFAPFEAVKMTDMIIKGTFSKPMVRWQYVTT